MEIKKKYIPLKDLEVYQLSRELARLGWQIYQEMDWQTRKVIGNQFIKALDSIGANIAEGYGRFHYLDQIRFYYNSRGSLFEAILHWTELLRERGLTKKKDYQKMKLLSERLNIKLNNFIKVTYKAGDKKQ